MDSFNSNNLLKGSALFAGLYFVAKAGHRAYRSITNSETDQAERKARHLTTLGIVSDIALSESCTLSMGSIGVALLFVTLELHHN
ncbi:MAG: hypothetical protein Barrevirus6_3 [Barrevirus sp.]|uniref:Uncharacterized protein n=1 Tax=Barrevirus sp. TaxID=2487763 RepID=A0A3G4ZPZ9_9VIRU|nr:MAG: hypothetical protein Barrevirus6_3 [Barrevirus sp.]